MRDRSLGSDTVSFWWKTGYWWGIAAVMTVLVMGLDAVGYMGWWRAGAEQATSAIDSRWLSLGTKIQTPVEWVVAGRDASGRIADLEQRLALAAVDAAYVAELEYRVSALEQMSVTTGIGKRADRIVPLLDYGERLMAGTGSRDGAAEGQVVTDSNGVLLGKLTNVGMYLSDVGEVSDMESRIAVKTLTGNSQGIVEGRGNLGQAELIEVLQTDPLVVGDVVVTSGKDGHYPPGLVVGQVTVLTGSAEQVTKGARLTLLSRREGWGALW